MNYFKDSMEEIRKVTWPTRNQAVSITIVTIIFIIISTAFFALVDLGFQKGYEFLLKVSPKVQNEQPVEVDAEAPGITATDENGQPIGIDIKKVE